MAKSFVYCLVNAFLVSVKTTHQLFFAEFIEHADHRQAADELGNEPESKQILRLNLAHDSGRRQRGFVGLGHMGTAQSRGRCCPTRRRMILSSPTKAPPQMKRMRSVLTWIYSLVRVLASALGRDVADGALENFQQPLLDALRPRQSRVIETLSVLRPILSISSM